MSPPSRFPRLPVHRPTRHPLPSFFSSESDNISPFLSDSRESLPTPPTVSSTKPPPIPKIRQNRPSPVRKRGNPPAHHATWLTYGRFGQLENAKWLIYGTQIAISQVWGAELQRPYSGYSSFGAIYKPLSKTQTPESAIYKRVTRRTPVQSPPKHAPTSPNQERSPYSRPAPRRARPSILKIRQKQPIPVRFRGSPPLPPLIPKSDKTSPFQSGSGESLPTSPQPPPQTTLIPRVKHNPPRSRPIPGKPAQSAPSHSTPSHAIPPRTAPFAQSTERR